MITVVQLSIIICRL